jgi:hypothetical protein
VWGRICGYRLDRRPGKVAANILMDAQKDLRRAAALQGQPAEDLPPDYPAPGSHGSAAEELVELLEEAVSRGTLTAADAQMVAAFRIGGARIADIGLSTAGRPEPSGAGGGPQNGRSQRWPGRHERLLRA